MSEEEHPDLWEYEGDWYVSGVPGMRLWLCMNSKETAQYLLELESNVDQLAKENIELRYTQIKRNNGEGTPTYDMLQSLLNVATVQAEEDAAEIERLREALNHIDQAACYPADVYPETRGNESALLEEIHKVAFAALINTERKD